MVKCSECIYSVHFPGQRIECHRYAPRAIVSDPLPFGTGVAWPEVGRSNGCGEGDDGRSSTTRLLTEKDYPSQV